MSDHEAEEVLLEGRWPPEGGGRGYQRQCRESRWQTVQSLQRTVELQETQLQAMSAQMQAQQAQMQAQQAHMQAQQAHMQNLQTQMQSQNSLLVLQQRLVVQLEAQIKKAESGCKAQVEEQLWGLQKHAEAFVREVVNDERGELGLCTFRKISKCRSQQKDTDFVLDDVKKRIYFVCRDCSADPRIPSHPRGKRQKLHPPETLKVLGKHECSVCMDRRTAFVQCGKCTSPRVCIQCFKGQADAPGHELYMLQCPICRGNFWS